MKIEKLNDDKIRITLNIEDLKQNDIDFQSFMSNSIESQELFLYMLDRAQEEVGFVTDNYKIMIEALAMSDGNFILTVTRILPDNPIEKNNKNVKLHIKRKTPNLNFNKTIYSFNSFDEFCYFCNHLNSSVFNNIDELCENNSLYLYNSKYYLVLDKIHTNCKYLKPFATSISEFAHFVNISELFEKKLLEYGEIIMKDNAISVCKKHFA